MEYVRGALANARQHRLFGHVTLVARVVLEIGKLFWFVQTEVVHRVDRIYLHMHRAECVVDLTQLQTYTFIPVCAYVSCLTYARCSPPALQILIC